MSTLITTTAQIGTIKDAGGNNTAMTIDSTGRILTPARPFFRVGMTTSQTGLTNHNVIFDTVKQNIGNYYNVSNGRFTAPISGTYQFNHSILLQSVATSDDGITVHYYKNDTDDSNKWMFDRADGTDANGYSGSGGYLNSRGAGAMQLSAGDYVTVLVYASGAVGVHGNSQHSWSQWCGYLIG